MVISLQICAYSQLCADQALVYGFLPQPARASLSRNSYFSGFKNKDVAFFHQASKTMIEADLLFNLPATEQVRLHCTCTECLCYES